MIRVMSRKLVRKTIEMIRKLSEVKEEEEDEEEFNDEDYEDDEDYEEDDEEYEDDDEYDDEEDEDYEEKTEEELREEKEDRSRLRKEKIEAYEKFWKEFGKNIKLGIVEDPGNRGKLARLTRWYSTRNSTQLISFDTYVENMKEN
jgi:heat shock protein beta